MSDWRVTCSSSSTPAGTYVQGIITLIRQISSVARHHGRVPDRLSTCSSHRSIKHGGDETTASTSPTPRSAQMTSYVAGLLARQGQAQPPRRVAWGAWLSGCCQGGAYGWQIDNYLHALFRKAHNPGMRAAAAPSRYSASGWVVCQLTPPLGAEVWADSRNRQMTVSRGLGSLINAHKERILSNPVARRESLLRHSPR